jgi:hypothetical protein
MNRLAVSLTALIVLTGCTGKELKPEIMGTTAKCLHTARTNLEVGSKAHTSAVNECMWTKASDLKD